MESNYSSHDKWRAGQRVFRADTGEQGVVSDAGHMVKVTWDGGQISYYDYDRPHTVLAVPNAGDAEPNALRPSIPDSSLANSRADE